MEESGLLTPLRTTGNTRRHSDDDVSQIAEVSNLLEQGVNAASIHRILALRAEVTAALAENEALRRRLAISENHMGPDATADT